jgi:hypothetical protein
MQTFTGREYLKIDVASNFGLDKINWDTRLAWFDQHESQLEEMVHLAETPALFYAGVQAWRTVQRNEPIGYMISLDATSSGMQLLAALTGDRKCAELCNVVDTGRREDAYTGIYVHMLDQIDDASKIDRKDTKTAIMTAFYSSKAEPKRVFGEGKLLDVFYDSLSTLAPGAWELTEAMTNFWNPDTYSHDWVLPDNFHVHVKVMDTELETVHFLNEPFDIATKVNRPMEGGRSLGANTVHSIDGMVVRELTRRCDYDPAKIDAIHIVLAEPAAYVEAGGLNDDDRMVETLWRHYEQSGYLSARILDHLTSRNVRLVDRRTVLDLVQSLPKRPFKVVSIHDCFRCLPHYGNDLRRQYNLQLQLIAKSELLSFIISQLLNRPVTIGKLDPALSDDILDTNYALS